MRPATVVTLSVKEQGTNWKLEIVTISTPLIPYRKNFLWYIVLAFVSTSVHQTVRNSTRSSKTLAARHGIQMPEDQLLAEAGKWEISHGGLTGRTAQQFIDHLLGKEENS